MFELHNGVGEHDNLKVLDVFVDGSSDDSLHKGALEVLQHVRPHWHQESICFKIFTDGCTNQLLGCWEREEEVLEEGGVLLRVYGQNTELFIDRLAEVANMQVMHANGLAAPLHCAFRNGLCYGFNPGRVMDIALVRDPHLSKLVAQTMARMHCVPLHKDGRKPVPSLFPTMHKYLGLIPTSFDDLDKNQRFITHIPSKSELEREVQLMEEHLPKLGSPVVFCHNDLLVKNIIVQEREDKVVFIDFEYADNNYQALDIGNHFCEFAGLEDLDASLYPEREFQLVWLRHYLEEWKRLMGLGQVTDSDVQLLYVQVNKFALASCMFWSLWALIQSAHSTIKVDFLQYAMARLDMYKMLKDQFMEMEVPNL